MVFTLLYLLPVIDFAVLAVRIVKCKNGELIWVASAENFSHNKAS